MRELSTPRARKRAVTLGCHLAVIVLGLAGLLIASAAGSGATATVFLLALLVYLAAIRRNPLPGALARALIKRTPCAACGAELGLEDHWGCSCGYTAPRERHAFAACSECQRRFTWIECPHCAASLPV